MFSNVLNLDEIDKSESLVPFLVIQLAGEFLSFKIFYVRSYLYNIKHSLKLPWDREVYLVKITESLFVHFISQNHYTLKDVRF